MNAIRTLVLVAVTAAGLAMASGCGKNTAAKGEHYGEPFTAAPTATLAQLLEKPDAFQHQTLHVKGTIERQCPMSGCWFFITDGQGRSMKIELGDYLPKLPQRVGRTAEVEGELIRHGDSHLFIGTRVTFE